MMILSLIRSVFGRRISPAADRLSARLLRWGAPPPRLNRPPVGGSARSALWCPREALASKSAKESSKIPALSVFWAMVARQGVCIRMVLSGTSSPISDPWGGSSTRPASPWWGPARVVVRGASVERPDSTCHPGLVENCYSKKKKKMRGYTREISPVTYSQQHLYDGQQHLRRVRYRIAAAAVCCGDAQLQQDCYSSYSDGTFSRSCAVGHRPIAYSPIRSWKLPRLLGFRRFSGNRQVIVSIPPPFPTLMECGVWSARSRSLGIESQLPPLH